MRVINTIQAFEEHMNAGKDTIRIGETACRTYSEMVAALSPETYEKKYGEFLEEKLHKCLKCHCLFDDKADMSKREPGLCKGCDTDHVDDNVKRLKEDGPEVWEDDKGHVRQGEQ